MAPPTTIAADSRAMAIQSKPSLAIHWPTVLVPIVAGTILVAASITKAAYPIKPLWLISWSAQNSVWIWALLAAIEMALGLALLLRVGGRATIGVAAVAFGLLGVYSIILIAESAQSCGCFGKLLVPPSCTLVLDITLGIALAIAASFGSWSSTSRLLRLRQLIVGVSPILVALIAFYSDPARAHVGDGLQFDSENVDLGVLNELQATKINHRFLLTNSTTQAAKILGVEKTCTCTSAVASKTDILPGETVSIDTTIDWHGRRGRQISGLYVNTKNPHQTFVLTVMGYVDTGIAISPPTVNFGIVAPNSVKSRLVYLGRTDATERLAFKNISPSTDAIQAEQVATGDPNSFGTWYRISLFADRLPQGSGDASVLFTPSESDLPKATLKVHFWVQDSVTSLSPLLRFQGRLGETLVARFHCLQGLPDLKFTILDENGAPRNDIFTITSIQASQDHKDFTIDVAFIGKAYQSTIVFQRLIILQNNKELGSVSLARF